LDIQIPDPQVRIVNDGPGPEEEEEMPPASLRDGQKTESVEGR
jgi:hypothetical protein